MAVLVILFGLHHEAPLLSPWFLCSSSLWCLHLPGYVLPPAPRSLPAFRLRSVFLLSDHGFPSLHFTKLFGHLQGTWSKVKFWECRAGKQSLPSRSSQPGVCVCVCVCVCGGWGWGAVRQELRLLQHGLCYDRDNWRKQREFSIVWERLKLREVSWRR